MSTPAERRERAQQWDDFNRSSNAATQANASQPPAPSPSTEESE